MDPTSAPNTGRRNAMTVSGLVGLLTTSLHGIAGPLIRGRESPATEARHTMEEVLARLNWALDDGEFILAGALFSADASLKHGSEILEGRTAIANSFAANAGKYVGCASTSSNIAVYEGTSRSMRVRSYRFVYAGSEHSGETQRPSLVGLYQVEDALISIAAGWAIQRRNLRTIAESPYPW